MPEKFQPLNQLKQLLAQCEAQMAGMEKACAKADVHKIQKPPPKTRMRKS
jgi:hypothetical protein